MAMRLPLIALGVLSAMILGCGAQSNAPNQFRGEVKKAAGDPAAGAQEGRADNTKQPADEPLPRKIIYTAQVDLNVNDFDNAVEQLGQIAKKQGGYVAKSYVSGSPGSPRTGNWTIRVPVDNFEPFMNAVEKLGELRSSKTDSEDITDKFYDLKAHIKTNKVEEEGLQKLLVEKAPTSKLEDLVAVRRELRAIRAEIEQQEGRLQRWDKESSLATATITLNDRFGYVPANTPPFGTTVGLTFAGSLDAMLMLGKGLVLFAVALAPWLALLAVPTVPAYLWLRRQLRANQAAAKPKPSPAPPPEAPTLSAV
jgi:hypothetical protein